MSATMTQPKTSATITMIDRLEATPTPLHFGHGSEILPWLQAAKVGGFELPPEVLSVAEVALHLARERAAHQPPAHRKTDDAEALIGGGRLASILDSDAQYEALVARAARADRLLTAAENTLPSLVRDAFGPVRDSLIASELRTAIEELIEKATRAAGALAAFAPEYGPELLASGNAKQLDQWRGSRQLQRDLEVLVDAWLASWRQTATRGHKGVGREYLPARAGGFYCWVSPDQVNPEALRLGHDTEVLRIAAQSGYRLLSPSELQPLMEEIDANLPKHPTHNAHFLIRRGVCGS